MHDLRFSYNDIFVIFVKRHFVTKLTDCNVTGLTCFLEYRSYNILHGCLDWVNVKN